MLSIVAIKARCIVYTLTAIPTPKVVHLHCTGLEKMSDARHWKW